MVVCCDKNGWMFHTVAHCIKAPTRSRTLNVLRFDQLSAPAHHIPFRKQRQKYNLCALHVCNSTQFFGGLTCVLLTERGIRAKVYPASICVDRAVAGAVNHIK